MKSVDRERIKELLSRAVRLPAHDRATFIEQNAGGNREIAAEALDLLRTLDDTAFMSAPTGAGLTATLAASDALPERPGGRIGRYRLLQLIGEGGFGAVFMAEQTEPVVRRVALKVIKAGMDTKQVIARFEAERQALALMDHPNIARVLDAGATEGGRPYFVMELVRGDPVTAYCDRERLSVTQRLELFRDVCHAVQHAHQKGIIHRDLKPTNVLVTISDGAPLPKVIDFGIAKATAGRLTEKTLFTELHQLIGTPQYMSPEQAEVSGVDIDTRSDIYALGVLLYELLAGSTPLEGVRLRSAPFAEIQRMIREEEPPRPSLRLASMMGSSAQVRLATPAAPANKTPDSSAIEIAQRRRSEPVLLSRALRGDLDWIVMKCLEKERHRRYPTASALADDIARYLDHQPVLATPPSKGYRLRKLVRRNRGAVLAGALIAVTLLVATGVSVTFGLSEARQRQAAQAAEADARVRAAELEQVARFQQEQLSGIDAQSMGVRLRADLLQKARAAAERAKLPPEDVDAHVKELETLIGGSDFTGMALEALDDNFFQPALAAIDAQFSDQPLIQARLLQTLASTLRELGLLDAASSPQDEALAIRRRELGGEHPDTLTSINEMGFLLWAKGKLAETEPYFREALTLRRRVLGEVHLDTLVSINNMGALLQARGQPAEAEPYLRESMDKRRRVLGADHAETLTSINNMGYLLQVQGKLAEAEPYYREALEKRRRVLGEEHPSTLTSINNVGSVLKEQGRLAEAEPYFREVMQKSRRVLGEEHPDTLRSLSHMASLLQAQGKLGEAEPYWREVMEKARRVLGEEHPNTLICIHNMGGVLLSQGKLAEAEPYFREALDKRRRVLGEQHPETLISIINMGGLMQAQGRATEALELLLPIESAVHRTFAEGKRVRVGQFLTALGRARVDLGEFEAAEANLSEAYAILSQAKGATEQHRDDVRTGMVELYDAWHAAEPEKGHNDRADQWRDETADTRP